MLWLSECTDIPVIVKGDGKLVGYVKNVYFDKIGRVFIYFDIETGEGAHLFLPVGAATPKQALILDDATLAMLQEDVDVSALLPSLLGLPAYTLSGIKKGEVLDAKFSDTGELCRLILSEGDIPPSQIACIGDVVLVKNAKPASRIPRPKKDYPVQVLQDDSGNASASESQNGGEHTPYPRNAQASDASPIDIAHPQDKVVQQDIAPKDLAIPQNGAHWVSQAKTADASGQSPKGHFGATALPVYGIAPPAPAISISKGEPMFSQGALNAVLDGDSAMSGSDGHNPTRIICDYEFLLGRTLGADLRTYTGELLAPKGAIITANVVELARAHGKLVDLTLNSVKQRQ